MTRIDSLNILGTDSGKLALEAKYAPVIENISTKLLSSQLKNKELSGDPTTGTIIAKRFANAKSAAYGTARGANKGSAVKGKEVVIKIDQNKEIIEEVENKDTIMLGVDGLINKRVGNHKKVLELELEKAFFAKAEESATNIEVNTITKIADKLDKVIDTLKTVKNDFVESVPGEDIVVTLNVKAFTAMRQYLDGLNNPNVNSADGQFGYFHGIRVEQNLYQTVDCIAMRIESVAQPVRVSVCNQGKIQLSDAYGFGLFYYYGTEAVTPDLIFKATLTA